MRTLTRTVASVALALALGGLSGCASTPVVTAEQAPGVDLTTYPTFAFFEPFDLEREGYGTFAGERARAVLRREMESRGYRLDPENPSVRLNLIAAPPERARGSSNVSLGLGLGFGGGSTRGSVGLGVPLGGSGPRTPSRYPGALAVDVVEVSAKRVVWSGSVDVARSGRDGERRAFEEALIRVMAGLPPRSVVEPR